MSPTNGGRGAPQRALAMRRSVQRLVPQVYSLLEFACGSSARRWVAATLRRPPVPLRALLETWESHL